MKRCYLTVRSTSAEKRRALVPDWLSVPITRLFYVAFRLDARIRSALPFTFTSATTPDFWRIPIMTSSCNAFAWQISVSTEPTCSCSSLNTKVESMDSYRIQAPTVHRIVPSRPNLDKPAYASHSLIFFIPSIRVSLLYYSTFDPDVKVCSTMIVPNQSSSSSPAPLQIYPFAGSIRAFSAQ